MNRKQRRAHRSGYESSDDMLIPLGDFVTMFKLTEEEVIAEGRSGRLVASGVPVPGGMEQVKVRESSAWKWLRSSLPPNVRAKVETAGGFERLQKWRYDWIMAAKIDFLNNTITFPDGTTVHDVRVSPRKPQ